jgi:hypothetical protein
MAPGQHAPDGFLSTPERFAELSEPMQRALRRAASGIPAARPRTVGVQPATLTALARMGLVVERVHRKRGRVWKTTERGLGLLSTERQQFLHQRAHRPYTDDPAQAARDAGEVVDETTLAGFRRNAHATEHDRLERLLAERQRLQVHERMRLLVADAAARGVELDSHPTMRLIRRKLQDLEGEVHKAPDRYADAEPRLDDA